VDDVIHAIVETADQIEGVAIDTALCFWWQIGG
jgi:hypothetical protein